LRWIDPTYQGTTLLEHEEAAFAQVGTDMWIIGGRSYYGQQTGSVERFSLLTMRGEVRPEWEMPMPVRQAGAAQINGKIYVAGGYDETTGKYVSALQIFDTATGTWTRGRNLPQPLSQGSVVAVSGKLWVIGGRSPNNTGLRTTYLYDPATNQWQAKALLPLKRAYAGVATPVAGQIWLVSGYTESGGTWYRTKDVLAYTIATNTWDVRDDIPLIGEHAAGGVTNIGGKVFAVYGDGDYGAGEWLAKPGPSAGLAWFRNIARAGSMGTYTPMLGKIGNTIFMISGSRTREVWKFESP
jgi:N-acetylneuraminic acid mutarotase